MSTPPPPVLDEPTRKRIDGWKAKLIDLSRLNRLLHYRHHRASSVQIVQEDPREVLRLLLAGKKMGFDPRPEGEAPAESPPRTGDLRLQTDLPGDVLAKVLQKLQRDSRASLEEQGFNTLFLAMGILEFTVPSDPQPWRAPLVLFPVQLLRRGVRGEHSLAAYEDEIRVNPSLCLKLENEFGVKVGPFEVDETFSYDAVRSAFDEVAKTRPGWRVSDEVHLAPFSFAKIPLYEDLARHAATIGTRPIVATIATGTPSPALRLGPLPRPADVEGAAEAGDLRLILDADSSQEAAILAARQGHSFVVQGPPGTGKSQTIANVIADALSAKRTVLFVSEKMAALEVVHRRLSQAGLGDFCLELHSHKANKRAVIQSIGRSWTGASTRVQELLGRPAELRDVRGYLEAYVAEMGKPLGRAGLPTHRVFGEAARLEGVPAVAFAVGAAEEMDRATLERVLRTLRELAEVRKAVDPPWSHPWRGVRLSATGVSTTQDVRRLLNLLHAAVEQVESAAARVAALWGVPASESVASVARSLELARTLRDSPGVPPDFLADRRWSGFSPQVLALLEKGRERQGLRASLLERYDRKVLDLDALGLRHRLRAGGGPFGWFRRRRAVTELRVVARSASSLTAGAAAEDVGRVLRVREVEGEVRDATPVLEKALGARWEGLEGDWVRLSGQVEWARRLLESWPSDSVPSDVARRAAAREGAPDASAALDAATRAVEALEARWAELAALLRLDAPARFSGDWRAAPLRDARAMVDEMVDGIERLPDWIAWQATRAKASALGLSEYLDRFDEGRFESRHLLNAWFRAYARALAERALAGSPLLQAFQAHLHEAKIARFRELEERQLKANAPAIAAALRATFPSPSMGAVADSEVGVLRRQMELQTRHMPTRRLLERIPTLLRTLKPCLMMSPLSAATYLPPDREPFDLVVFDEASQICTEDAIGALARGKQAVVAGDSKQLPPTSFFESRLAERDEDAEEGLVDMKSILDECVGRLPDCALLWHYRSRDESLISFSNAKFYGNLLTFPNPVRDPRQHGISFVHVPDGVYDPGKTRTNPREAEAVADHAFRLLRERPQDTLGIVTFSTAQRDAVLDAIDARRRADESLEPRFATDAIEPVFVKNLESVQGDERDVILFSVGYGKDAAGAFLHSFGPLNLDGGERRLNVAVSRSRKQMVVFASILPEDIDPSRVTRPGAKLLREYLERARRGLARGTSGAEPVDPETLPPVVRAVLSEVSRTHAYEVNLGESEFRIDVAVRHPDRPDQFMLAILCDVPAPGFGGTTRDRERVRHDVLTRLGWRIHRVWTPDWLRFRDREVSRLRSALDAARSAGPGEVREPPKAAAPAAAVRAEAVEAPEAGRLGEWPPRERHVPGVVPYEAARIRGGRAEDFHAGPLDRIARDVARVLEVESPVHVEVLARRVADGWGLQRLTDRLLDRLRSALERTPVERRHEFLHVPGRTVASARSATDDVQRPIEHIAPEELGFALRSVTEACFSLSPEALVREAARVLGFRRATEDVSAAMTAALREEVDQGRLSQGPDGWIRPVAGPTGKR